jgi:hypothetical protein
MSEDHSADRARRLAPVPADGSAIGNTTLIRQLGWAENRYWYARDSLLEAGVIVRAKGRGGAVRRAHADETTAPAARNTRICRCERMAWRTYVYEMAFSLMAGSAAGDEFFCVGNRVSNYGGGGERFLFPFLSTLASELNSLAAPGMRRGDTALPASRSERFPRAPIWVLPRCLLTAR